MNKILISENALTKFVRIYRIFSNLKMFNYYLLLSSSWVLSFDKNTQKCPNLQNMSELREITVFHFYEILPVIPLKI